jgi:hypothetical protein
MDEVGASAPETGEGFGLWLVGHHDIFTRLPFCRISTVRFFVELLRRPCISFVSYLISLLLVLCRFVYDHIYPSPFISLRPFLSTFILRFLFPVFNLGDPSFGDALAKSGIDFSSVQYTTH